jgi:hypothetical protein
MRSDSFVSSLKNFLRLKKAKVTMNVIECSIRRTEPEPYISPVYIMATTFSLRLQYIVFAVLFSHFDEFKQVDMLVVSRKNIGLGSFFLGIKIRIFEITSRLSNEYCSTNVERINLASLALKNLSTTFGSHRTCWTFLQPAKW